MRHVVLVLWIEWLLGYHPPATQIKKEQYHAN
jgi:hypothetical protein